MTLTGFQIFWLIVAFVVFSAAISIVVLNLALSALLGKPGDLFAFYKKNKNR